MPLVGEFGAAMREPQRVLQRTHAVANALDALLKRRVSLVVLTAQLLELGVLRQVLRGGIDARLRGEDVVVLIPAL